MTARDDLNTPAIALVGLIGAIVVFAIVVLLMVVFYRVEADQQFAKDVSQPYGQASRLAADQQGRLASYGWVDQKRGIAYIPVTRAMELVVSELAQDPEADVTGVAPPPDAGKEGKDDR